MSRRRPLGGVLFWGFFAAYVAAVVVLLVFGLAPSVVKEFGAVHQSMHDYADDALAANREVTISIDSRESEHLYRIEIVDGDGTPVTSSMVVLAGRRETVRFDAPPPGSYRLVVDGHEELESELRFEEDGAPATTLRVREAQHRFEPANESGWTGVARRVAEASHHADHGGRVTLETMFSALNLGLGLLIVIRRPHDRTARLLAVAMVGTAITFNHQSHSTVRDYLIGDWWFVHDLCHLLSGVAYMYAVIVFPDGRLLPLDSRHRALVRVAYATATLVLAVGVLSERAEGHPGQPFFTVLFGLLIPLVGVSAQTYRLRRATDPVVSAQSRLLRWALLPMLCVGVPYALLTAGSHLDWVEDVGLAIFPALFALVPIALVMGILRYRLWDIDVLVSRTILSLGLAAFIGGVYVVVVVLLGHVIGDSAGLKIVATAIAAVAFEPVRELLGRLANRLVYGPRATPYEVMVETGARLEGAISVDEILPRIAEAAVTGVGGIAGEVTAFLGEGSFTVSWPRPDVVATFPYVRPVIHRGEEVGLIVVAMAPGERLKPDGEELLSALASQAGLAVSNAALALELRSHLDEISKQAADLRASRQRIVTAREAQRLRVVQLIHDRVEVRLEDTTTKLRDVEAALASEPEHAVVALDELLDGCGEALDALRDLARGIFPAILADQGLVPALDAYVLQARLPIDITVDGSGVVGRHDPQLEATVYFCVIQAIANAGAYASGSNVFVTVHDDAGRLQFSVSDDGPGTAQWRLDAGADVHDMRDRVNAIGGAFTATSSLGEGTAISGWVPTSVLAVR